MTKSVVEPALTCQIVWGKCHAMAKSAVALAPTCQKVWGERHAMAKSIMTSFSFAFFRLILPF